MKKAVVLVVFLVLAANLFAAEIPLAELNERRFASLRYCLGLLVSQLEELLLAMRDEPVSWQAKSAIAATLRVCNEIMTMLEYR